MPRLIQLVSLVVVVASPEVATRVAGKEPVLAAPSGKESSLSCGESVGIQQGQICPPLERYFEGCSPSNNWMEPLSPGSAAESETPPTIPLPRMADDVLNNVQSPQPPQNSVFNPNTTRTAGQSEGRTAGRALGLASFASAPAMIGDSLPTLILTHQPVNSDDSAASLYSYHVFKIAENESPWPTNRVYAGVNVFNNVPGTDSLSRFTLGFERTFGNDVMSLGVRVPVWTADPEAVTGGGGIGTFPFGDGGSSTAFGDLTVTFKSILLHDGHDDVISAGLSITAPTGPSTIGGVNPFYTIDNVSHKGTIQPWIGFYHAAQSRTEGFFTQGFLAYDQAFDSDDSGMFYVDLGMGYRIPTSGSRITAITPIFEAHWSNPLHNRSQSFTPTASGVAVGFPAAGGVFAYRHQVNLTTALNVEINGTTHLTLGLAVPTTGPRFMDIEFIAQLTAFQW